MRGFWDKGWLPTVAAKSSYFHAVAQHQLGLASQVQKSFGEAVARMKRGVELVTEAEKRGEGYFKPYVSMLDCVIMIDGCGCVMLANLRM